MIAMANAVDIEITLDDFQKMSNETPLIADLKPSGKYLMEDLHAVGGIPAVMKFLLERGLLHGDCLTCTGKTLAENLKDLPGLSEGQDVIRELNAPLKANGHIQILYGNLAEEGSVAKITGKEGSKFVGPAIVFHDEFAATAGILDGKVKKGNVIVINYQGPKGGPGMPEMLKPTSAVMGAGLGQHVALITDGRFSGGSHGFVVGHICPEAQEGGLIGLIQDGDMITIDATKNIIHAELTKEQIEERKRNWKPKELPTRGILGKYARVVGSASKGCLTDLP
jgi:dihydroxy-acid dehydratase